MASDGDESTRSDGHAPFFVGPLTRMSVCVCVCVSRPSDKNPPEMKQKRDARGQPPHRHLMNIHHRRIPPVGRRIGREEEEGGGEGGEGGGYSPLPPPLSIRSHWSISHWWVIFRPFSSRVASGGGRH